MKYLTDNGVSHCGLSLIFTLWYKYLYLNLACYQSLEIVSRVNYLYMCISLSVNVCNCVWQI